MSDDQEDLHPNKVNVYGWVVLHKTEDGVWQVNPDEKYPGLPEHEEFLEVAQERAAYLRMKGITARVLGLLQDQELDGDSDEQHEQD
jgi:hypothetical protein